MKKWSGQELEEELQRQLKLLKFQTVEITPENEFIEMLKHSLSSGVPLRVKCGIDPTGSDVHLGHCIPYLKMRQFQDLGHIGVVVIGDYTAQIGDPSGKNESRPTLSAEQVKENAQSYLEQVYKILDPKQTEVRWQSEWFNKASLADLLTWAHQTTVAKLLSHDTFRLRIEQQSSLGLHELLYPVLQGIDSVHIQADVELGGSDQKFNVLMGRDYQRDAQQRPQVAMLLPIILGTCGVEKMSKSLKNYIGVLDEPFDQFGKVMSIPDDLMLDWAKYVSQMNEQQYLAYSEKVKSNELHPNEAKKKLAKMIVAIFHGSDVADQMQQQFETVFAKKKLPDEINEFKITEPMKVIDFLVQSKLCQSNGEAKRMIQQNAVSVVEAEKITSSDAKIDADYHQKVIKVGKRKFMRVIYE